MTALTAGLGRFVADLTLSAVPKEGLETAKAGIADCFGVMVAGSRDPAIALIDRELSHSGGTKPQASLFPSGEKREAADAALINGVAAHVLDFDDVGMGGHPSAVLVPAILAQAEASGSTGAEMLTAYIAGYEVWGELLAREPVALHSKGWHPTAMRGTIAAAAAAAKLRRLDAAQTTTAIALSASMAGGVMSNFGTMTKSFHVGRAAQSGMLAAQLAGAGMTASPDALEHRSGFLMAVSPQNTPDLERDFDAASKTWYITRIGLGIKRYPICYATHRAIDGALDLIEKNKLKPDDVAHIHVLIGANQALMLRNAKPQTGLEAKFSMQFAMASALVAHNVGLAQVTDDFVRKPEVQAIFPRLSMETTDAVAEGTSMAPFNWVEFTTAGGQKLSSGEIHHAKGSFQKPVSRDELYLKFADCLGSGIAEAAKSRTFENLMTLDRLSGTRDLVLHAQ